MSSNLMILIDFFPIALTFNTQEQIQRNPPHNLIFICYCFKYFNKISLENRFQNWQIMFLPLENTHINLFVQEFKGTTESTDLYIYICTVRRYIHKALLRREYVYNLGIKMENVELMIKIQTFNKKNVLHKKETLFRVTETNGLKLVPHEFLDSQKRKSFERRKRKRNSFLQKV